MAYKTLIQPVLDRMNSSAPASAVEALMRVLTGGTLDHLDRREFLIKARLAATVWDILDEDTRAFYVAQAP